MGKPTPISTTAEDMARYTKALYSGFGVDGPPAVYTAKSPPVKIHRLAPRFDISPELTRALLVTDVKLVPVQLWPFDHFVIRFPTPVRGLLAGGSSLKEIICERNADGSEGIHTMSMRIGVGEVGFLQSDFNMMVLIRSEPKEGDEGRDPGWGTIIPTDFLFPGKQIQLDPKNRITFKNGRLADARDLSLMSEGLRGMLKLNLPPNLSHLPNEHTLATYLSTYWSTVIQHLTSAVCRYISSLSTNPVYKQVAAHNARRAATPLRKRRHVGPAIIQLGVRYKNSLPRGVGGSIPLSHRYIVRGHFREQPHGKGKKLRKTIFIQPFWKGPTDGEIRERIYKVNETEQGDQND